jgi:hypothetical protein
MSELAAKLATQQLSHAISSTGLTSFHPPPATAQAGVGVGAAARRQSRVQGRTARGGTASGGGRSGSTSRDAPRASTAGQGMMHSITRSHSLGPIAPSSSASANAAAAHYMSSTPPLQQYSFAAPSSSCVSSTLALLLAPKDPMTRVYHRLQLSRDESTNGAHVSIEKKQRRQRELAAGSYESFILAHQNAAAKLKMKASRSNKK